MEEYIDLFEKVITQTSHKVDYIDIRAGMSENTSILMKDGDVGVEIFLFLSGIGLYFSMKKNVNILTKLNRKMTGQNRDNKQLIINETAHDPAKQFPPLYGGGLGRGSDV